MPQGWIEYRTISFDEVIRGSYVKEYMTVSHRWETAEQPDPEGVQFEAIRAYAMTHPDVKYIFYDWSCFWQRDGRTPEQTEEFKRQLSAHNMLFIGTSILILLDSSYMSRFWTQFEAWLAFQKPTADGLVSAPADEGRCKIVPVHGANSTDAQGLLSDYGRKCTTAKAHRILMSADISVTNQGDKDAMMPLIGKIDEQVKKVVAWLDSQPPPLPSAAELRAINLTQDEVRSFKDGASCKFWFVKAEHVRQAPATSLLKLQHLRATRPEWLVHKPVSFVDGLRGAYAGSILVVSHRWESPGEPDELGVQLAAIQQFLADHPEVELVWYDYWCMPQGPNKSALDKMEQKVMLPNINLLYLFGQVLVLLDISYVSRFWTSFESFLAMRKVTRDGLVTLSGSELQARMSIMCLHNANNAVGDFLKTMWKDKSVAQAYEILKRPDVCVTNQSDKDEQLPKLLALDDFSKRMWREAHDAGAPAPYSA